MLHINRSGIAEACPKVSSKMFSAVFAQSSLTHERYARVEQNLAQLLLLAWPLCVSERKKKKITLFVDL